MTTRTMSSNAFALMNQEGSYWTGNWSADAFSADKKKAKTFDDLYHAEDTKKGALSVLLGDCKAVPLYPMQGATLDWRPMESYQPNSLVMRWHKTFKIPIGVYLYDVTNGNPFWISVVDGKPYAESDFSPYWAPVPEEPGR